MKNSILWKLSAAFAGLAGCLSLSFSSMAAVPAGALEGADESSVYGWVWDSDNYNHIIPVEISIYPAGNSQTLKIDTIEADDYQDKLQESIGDGYHGFEYPVDWSQFDETEFRVTARTAEDESVFLGELTYNKETHTCTLGGAAPAGNAPAPAQEPPSKTEADESASPQKQASAQEIGPGVPLPEPPKKEPEYISLGMFTTTGYCTCEKCCPSGSSLTYSGTVPQANHTISADISIFPIGTRLMIDDIIYTVEDIGSGVSGNKIDIFYATHEEAESHGVSQTEVFAVVEEEEEDS